MSYEVEQRINNGFDLPTLSSLNFRSQYWGQDEWWVSEFKMTEASVEQKLARLQTRGRREGTEYFLWVQWTRVWWHYDQSFSASFIKQLTHQGKNEILFWGITFKTWLQDSNTMNHACSASRPMRKIMSLHHGLLIWFGGQWPYCCTCRGWRK